MNDRTWLTLRRAVTLLLGAGGALMVGDYLYEGARRAEAEARLADVRAAWTVRGTPMFGCVARSATMERCYQHAQEVERRRAEAERAAFERRREEAEPKGETPPEIDSLTISPLDRLLEDSESAKHEAAHAVVAVRLGLPLESTDIIERHEAVGAAGNTIGVSQDFTTLREGSVRPWLKGTAQRRGAEEPGGFRCTRCGWDRCGTASGLG